MEFHDDVARLTTGAHVTPAYCQKLRLEAVKLSSDSARDYRYRAPPKAASRNAERRTKKKRDDCRQHTLRKCRRQGHRSSRRNTGQCRIRIA